MIDKRELLLARLFEVLSAIPEFNACVRNRGELPFDKQPGLVMMDGHEDVSEGDRKTGRISEAPLFVTLRPQVYFALDPGKPNNEDVGQRLNAYRVAILSAVLKDPHLREMTGTNGRVWYSGAETDLVKGGEMAGQMGLVFELTYVLRVSDLS